MINDRKMLKWQTAFFLPEHKKLLRKADNDYYKSEKPILDELQIEEIEQRLSESLSNQSLLTITTWKDGFFNSYVGYVTKVDILNKQIKIIDELEHSTTLDFIEIVNVYAV